MTIIVLQSRNRKQENKRSRRIKEVKEQEKSENETMRKE